MAIAENLFAAVGVLILTAASVMDIKKRKIPVFWPVAFGVIYFGFMCYSCIFLEENGGTVMLGTRIWNALSGSFPGLLLLILYRPSGRQIGLGDGLMLLGIGIFLGGDRGITVFMLSLGLLFIFSCIGMVIHKLNRRSCVPFAPFYLAAYLGVIIL